MIHRGKISSDLVKTEAFMNNKQFIFIGGLHRSGTSLLHDILRSHPDISGFANTRAWKDEGQHLQTVYPPAIAFGGRGHFGFNKLSFMDEKHHLVTSENSTRLLKEWGRYWDFTKDYLIEKSPPNIVRTRFLQQLFPKSIFIIMLRHPIAVAYATQKWSKSNIPSLIEHSLCCYERFREDMPFLNRIYVLRYETFILQPRQHIDELLMWIGVEPFQFYQKVRSNINDRYFKMWESDRHNFLKKLLSKFEASVLKFEERANRFSYSMHTPKNLLELRWDGSKIQ